jgi:hypothetical protein
MLQTAFLPYPVYIDWQKKEFKEKRWRFIQRPVFNNMIWPLGVMFDSSGEVCPLGVNFASWE